MSGYLGGDRTSSGCMCSRGVKTEFVMALSGGHLNPGSRVGGSKLANIKHSQTDCQPFQR